MERCARCLGAVLLADQLRCFDKGKTFHKVCFKCELCKKQLTPQSFLYNSDNQKFYCTTHLSTQQSTASAAMARDDQRLLLGIAKRINKKFDCTRLAIWLGVGDDFVLKSQEEMTDSNEIAFKVLKEWSRGDDATKCALYEVLADSDFRDIARDFKDNLVPPATSSSPSQLPTPNYGTENVAHQVQFDALNQDVGICKSAAVSRAYDLKNVFAAANSSDIHRTILLFGRSGNGVSTLGNVIAGTHLRNPPEEVFKEGCSPVRETLEAQEHITEIAGKKYRIVDTVGPADWDRPITDVLVMLARTCDTLREGINQILFVSSQKITREEVEAYNKLQPIFNEDIHHFTTLVRTSVSFFRNSGKCKMDVERLKASSDNARKLSVNVSNIIHVNNPNEDEIPNWVDIREESRSKILI